jgi:uncharacterized protein
MKKKSSPASSSPRSASYRKARLRHMLLTSVPGRLSGGFLARRHLKQEVVVREIDVVTPLWPAEFDGLRIGHLSDLHLGELMSEEQARAAIELLRQRSPDLVACTGDVVDLDLGHVAPVLEDLAAAAPSMGSFLVLGNHDHLDDADELAERARHAGVRVLRDEYAAVTHGKSVLNMAGLDWGKTARECAKRFVKAKGGEGVDLLLAHNPKAFSAAAKHDVALTLSGHTHGGQIAMRGLPRLNLAMAHRHRAGVYESGQSRLYVTTGLGALFPLRMNCPAEVVVITMRRDRGQSKSGDGIDDIGAQKPRVTPAKSP